MPPSNPCIGHLRLIERQFARGDWTRPEARWHSRRIRDASGESGSRHAQWSELGLKASTPPRTGDSRQARTAASGTPPAGGQPRARPPARPGAPPQSGPTAAVPVAVGPAAAVPTHQHRRVAGTRRPKDVIAVQPVRAVGHVALDIDARCVKRARPAHHVLRVVICRLKRHGHLAVRVGFKRQGHVQSAKKSRFNHKTRL